MKKLVTSPEFLWLIVLAAKGTLQQWILSLMRCIVLEELFFAPTVESQLQERSSANMLLMSIVKWVVTIAWTQWQKRICLLIIERSAVQSVVQPSQNANSMNTWLPCIPTLNVPPATNLSRGMTCVIIRYSNETGFSILFWEITWLNK